MPPRTTLRDNASIGNVRLTLHDSILCFIRSNSSGTPHCLEMSDQIVGILKNKAYIQFA